MPPVAIHAIETLQLHLRAETNVHLRDLQWVEAEATVLNALQEEEAEEDKRVVHELQYHELHIYIRVATLSSRGMLQKSLKCSRGKATQNENYYP